MSLHGKRYEAARNAIDRESTYSPIQAVRMLKEFPATKFDETIEVHFRLGLNVRHADEQLRGTLMLPHGTGKEVRVAVFAEGDKAREATEAGADVVGSADLAKRIEEGFLDFDVAVIDEIVRAKPAAAKGRYIKQITLASTMSPGIHLDPAKIRGIVEELDEAQEAVPA